MAQIPSTKKELVKYYAVRFKGRISMYLNPLLAVKRKLTVEDLKSLKKVHRKRLKLFQAIKEEEDIGKLHQLANQIDEIEFELQDGWNHPRNVKHHSWWCRLPKCRCGSMDNRDMYTTGLRSINGNCPLHGKFSV